MRGKGSNLFVQFAHVQQIQRGITHMQETLKLIRPSKVCQMLDISKATLYRMTQTPDFPKSVRISARAVAFDAAEIQEYINERKAERDQ